MNFYYFISHALLLTPAANKYMVLHVVTASVATERALVSTISDQQSPSLSLTNTHANNVKVSETSTRHRAEMGTKPSRCQILAKVDL